MQLQLQLLESTMLI